MLDSDLCVYLACSHRRRVDLIGIVSVYTICTYVRTYIMIVEIYMSGFAVRKDLLSIFFLFRFCCTINVYIAIAQWNLLKPPHHTTSLDYPENGSSLILYNLYNLDMHMKHRTHTHTHTPAHTRTVYNANACMYTWNVHIFNISLYFSRLSFFLSLSLSVFLFSFVCNLAVHFRSPD